MNRQLKRFVEKGLRVTGAASAIRAARRRNVLVLAYHNIAPVGEPVVGDRSLHLAQHEFARQLDWLRDAYDVVPLSAISEPHRLHGRPKAVITFDDAYRGAITVGIDELTKRRMPATIFVAPAFVGGAAFWWDVLAPQGQECLSRELRDYCIEALGGGNDLILRWAKEQKISFQCVPSHQTTATEDELLGCGASGAITFGSHTWSHPNIRRLSESKLQEELERSLVWLRARFDHVVPWLAYPYGLASATAATVIQRAGYEGAVLVSGGRANIGDLTNRRFGLPRVNVASGISFDGFVLRASGVLAI